MYLSIRHKIAVKLFASVFLLTLLVVLFQQYLTYKQIERHIREDAEASVRLAVIEVKKWFGKNPGGLLEDLTEQLGGFFLERASGIEVLEAPGGRRILFVKAEEGWPEDLAFLGADVRERTPENGQWLDLTGGRYISVFEEIPGTAYGVYYPIPITQLMQPFVTTIFWAMLISIIGLYMIFLFSISIVGKYVRRLRELNEKTKSIAEGDFDIFIRKSSDDEIGDLGSSFNKMVRSLSSYMTELKETTATQERFNREMELAAEIQQKALPTSIPAIEGLDLAAATYPAYEVGGDYYDVLFPGRGEVGIVVADAAGKGFPGTLFMTNSRSVFKVLSADEKAPDRILERMNDFIAATSSSGMFITMLYCVYDTRTKVLTYVNAGHYPPLIFRPRGEAFVEVREGGLPIGIMADQAYEANRVELKDQDVVILFTDGVVDKMNKDKDMFGMERLKKAVRESASGTAPEIFRKVDQEMESFARSEQSSDDMTMVVMKIGVDQLPPEASRGGS
ncbi:MAG: PP2C family protein-serine/threonine phosphatase [Candidatus Omnitrophota bacterium]